MYVCMCIYIYIYIYRQDLVVQADQLQRPEVALPAARPEAQLLASLLASRMEASRAGWFRGGVVPRGSCRGCGGAEVGLTLVQVLCRGGHGMARGGS